MNTSLRFREVLGRVPFLVDELDSLGASIAGTFAVEHKDDGTHGFINGDGAILDGDVDISGDLTVSGPSDIDFNGNITADTDAFATEIGFVGSSAINDAWLGAGVNLDGRWVAGENNDGSGTDQRISFSDLVAGQTPFMVRKHIGGAYFMQPGPVSRGAGMVAYLGNPNDGSKSGYWDGVFALKYFRNSATVAEGEWQDEAFAAGNFTSSTGTWTLTAPDQTLFRYSMDGNSMDIAFQFDTTSVSGGQAQLRFAVPGGRTIANNKYSTCFANDSGVGYVVACVIALAGLNFIIITLPPLGAGPNWAGSVNLTAVVGGIRIEVV